MEFTGTYYKCNDCGHFWDYNDFNCPECGSQNFEDKSLSEEIKEIEETLKGLYHMKEIHGE